MVKKGHPKTTARKARRSKPTAEVEPTVISVPSRFVLSSHNDVILAALRALRQELPETRFARLKSARKMGRSGWARRSLLLGHWDNGAEITCQRATYRRHHSS